MYIDGAQKCSQQEEHMAEDLSGSKSWSLLWQNEKNLGRSRILNLNEYKRFAFKKAYTPALA